MTQQTDKTYCYRYPHPALTVDCVIFGFDADSLKVLLVERGIEPFKGLWALPGGFMHIDETAEEAARRELREETNISEVYMEQFRVFSRVDRDPRERVVTVAFMALVRPADCHLIAGDDAANALWFDEHQLPPMAFDHAEIIDEARAFLSEKLRVKPVAFQLLNKVFSLSELQRVYEAINRTTYDRRNFQRKALQSGILEECSATPPQPIATCGSTPMPKMAAPAPKATGRPLRKLFSFRSRPSQSDADEGSTKDLFDF